MQGGWEGQGFRASFFSKGQAVFIRQFSSVDTRRGPAFEQAERLSEQLPVE
jgi:hypothetical protein